MPAIVVIPQGVEELLIQFGDVFPHEPARCPIRLLATPSSLRRQPGGGGPRVLLGEEEDMVGDIAAPGDGAQRGGAVETAVDAAMATQRPWLSAGVRFAVGTDKYPGLAHRSAHCRKTQPAWGRSPAAAARPRPRSGRPTSPARNG